MRFAHAHKLTTYLMVLSAFFALALSGELSLIAVTLAFIGIIGSWLWEPPRIRFERFNTAWTILSVLILAYTLLSAFIGSDYLLIGSEFLLYLLIAKLFNRRSCKDYMHVYVITFLMLVAGTVLNSEFSYGFFFLGYVVTATWALILFHLRREMEDNFLLKHSDARPSERVEVTRILNSRRIVGKRFFVGTSLVSLTIFLVSTVLFLTIPRIGFGLFFQKNRAGITMAGFSDGVRLGGHGTIKTDSTVVMRIEVAEPWQGREARNIHWRGVAFDRYKDGQWVRSNQAPRTRRHMTYSDAGEEQHHLLYDRPTPGPGVLEERTARAMRQEIYLEPIGYDVLFGASMPLAIEFESKLGMRSPRTERNDEMRFSHAAGVKYVVYSKLEPPEPQRLRAAETILPDSYRVYLQVPDEITDEVRNLAHEITRDAPTHYDKAVAVERWLESNLDYTLEMRDPGELEPLHFFLFDRQMGHCEYFASAMAILLREVGVPTRNVNGFLGGEWNEYNNYIAVRAGDAHSWVEVYFHGMGWVTFDPTPAAEVDQLGRGGLSLQDRMRRLIDTMRFRWFKWVIEYDLYRQMSLFRDLRDSVRGSAGSVRDQLGAVKDRVSEYKKPILIGIGVIGVAIFGFLWLRRRRYQLPGGLSRAKRQRTPISALYSAVLTRLAKRGHRRAPATTPREYARALAEADVPGAGAFGELTEIYYRSMYREDGGHSELAAARRLSEAIEDAFRTAKRAAATDARSA